MGTIRPKSRKVMPRTGTRDASPFAIGFGVAFLALSMSSTAIGDPPPQRPSPQSRTDQAVYAIGHVTPLRIPGLPDWPATHAANCYTASLREDLAQSGEMHVVVTPPPLPTDGRPSVELTVRGTFSDELVDCVRHVFESIHYYGGEGFGADDRLQRIADLRFEPELRRTRPLPTRAAARLVLEPAIARDGVVRYVDFEIARTRHYAEYRPYRCFDGVVTVEFIVAGFEGRCFHGNEWVEFGRERIRAQGAGHQCANFRRPVGHRVEYPDSACFELEADGSWRSGDSPVRYCGDGVCPSTP